MIDVAGQLTIGLAIGAFEGEEDIAGLPVPMKIVEVRVERMIGSIKIRVAVVNYFVQSEIKPYRLKVSFGN